MTTTPIRPHLVPTRSYCISTSLRSGSLWCSRVGALNLFPTHDGNRRSVFLYELKRSEESHVELAVFREVGLVVSGIAGFIAIARCDRGIAAVVLAASYVHATFGQEIFAGSHVYVRCKTTSLLGNQNKPSTSPSRATHAAVSSEFHRQRDLPENRPMGSRQFVHILQVYVAS